ncbi:MAG: hypothetical protein HZA08_02090 [Nitrospirae bacterium]|nr:hypothetical protein [Nitrospirota bacterium]
MSGALTKGHENMDILRQAQDDSQTCHGELVEPFYAVRRFSGENITNKG